MDQDILREIMGRSPQLTLPQALRELLEMRILAGTMEAGERINENALASRLDVNRATIREALTALAEAGLVEFVRNRGAFVRCVDLEDALDLYDVRAGLARTAGRLIAARITSSELANLDAIHQKLMQAAEAEDVDEYDQLNIDFHIALIACAHNAQLARLEEKVGRDIRLYLQQGVMSPRTLRISCKEHAAILDAVRASDAEKAAAAFEVHVLNGKHRMLESTSVRASANSSLKSRSS